MQNQTWSLTLSYANRRAPNTPDDYKETLVGSARLAELGTETSTFTPEWADDPKSPKQASLWIRENP